MKVFHDLHNLPNFKNAVLTIGSFDGVHCGHQKIIEKVSQLARRIDGESVLITFHPHPRLVVYPKDNSLQLITTIDEKVKLLERYGLDNVVIVPFTIEFSQQSADEYIQKFLVEKFQPKYLVIGYDHRFGLNRQGDVDYLKWYGKEAGYEVLVIEKQEVEDIAVSSTKIREALDGGKMQAAMQLLGHPFSLTGTVVHGQKIGATIGFPTANLSISAPNKLIPPNGIYAVHAWHQDERYGGMLYMGDRPTLPEYGNRTIEVNLFDFDKPIYGDKLRLELIAHIRADAKYDTLDALSAQLQKDKQSALQLLAKLGQETSKKKTNILPSVAIVILNYNGLSHLKRFLNKALKTSYPNLKVVVADNASTDESVAFLQEKHPQLPLITLSKNYGFANGYNQALLQVDADYYVLLNSDVEVLPDWLDPIIELMERDGSVGACQPKIKDFNRPEYFEYAGAAGGMLDYLGYPFCRGRIFALTEKDSGQYDGTSEIFWASGAALIIRAKLFHGIGGFDKDYFAHSEEIDLCWRLKRAGYKVMVRPRSTVYHVGGGTLNYNTPFKTYLNFRNSLYTILKNEPFGKLLWLIPARLLLDGLAGFLFLTQGKWTHIQSILKAHGAFYSNAGKMYRKRRYYRDLIDKVSISKRANRTGQYKGSIVWKYYGRGIRQYNKL
ncbi:MAG: bifunctional riboflavin kinase/FAD synthetase [Bacteroidota bacterium]